MTDYNTLFHGCVQVKKSERGIIPLRFSDRRLEEYRLCPEKPYSRFPASVYIEFETDANTVSFRFDCEKLYYVPVMFDIYENGFYTESVPVPLGMYHGEVKYLRRNKQSSTIRIYLPAYAEIYISEMSLGDWKATYQLGTKLLFIGDSIFQGLFGVHPSLAVVPTLGRLMNAEYLNISVGGECYCLDMLSDIAYSPDHIFIALGTNDWVFNFAKNGFDEKVRAFFNRVATLFPGVSVTVVSPIWLFIDENRPKADRDAFFGIRQTVEKTTVEMGFEKVDGFDMLVHRSEFFSDEAHPNDLGFQQYAANLYRAVKYRKE